MTAGHQRAWHTHANTFNSKQQNLQSYYYCTYTSSSRLWIPWHQMDKKKKKFRTETWVSLVDVNMDILTGIEEIFFSSSSFSSPLVFIAIYCHLVEQFLIALPGKVT